MAEDNDRLVAMTVELVSAFVSNNATRAEDLAGLIQSTHAALAKAEAPVEPEPREEPKPDYQPAVSIRKSLASRDHLVSLIDGKPYRTLKRHLKGHGLTPDTYRQRYGLKADYPMSASAYSEQRRAIANKLRLGRKSGGRQALATRAEPANVSPSDTPKRRGRPPKAAANTRTLSLSDALKRSRARLSGGDGGSED